MKKGRMISFIVVLFAVFIIFTLSARAELINRGNDSLGNRLIYDNDLNITWYDYSTGFNTWQNQMNWASALSVTFGSNTYDDWRLPMTVDGPYVWGYNGSTTAGYNITSSEMGHLFYTELGNKGYYDTSGNALSVGWGLKNKGPFINLTVYYWSGTVNTVRPDFAWTFGVGGDQNLNGKTATFRGLAVRVGDVPQLEITPPPPPPVVPEPISSILFLTGGATLIGRKYLRREKIEV